MNGIIKARDGHEAQYGFNDTFPGDDCEITAPVVLEVMFANAQKAYEYSYHGPLPVSVGWFGVVQRREPNVIGALDYRDYALVCIVNVKPMSQKEYSGTLREIDAVIVPRLKKATTDAKSEDV